MEETADISEFSAILTPGDIVVLYTDGVTEASNGGSFFGESGIAEVLGACAGLTAQAVADAVVAALWPARTVRPATTSRSWSSMYRPRANADACPVRGRLVANEPGVEVCSIIDRT
jgi:hypothetical protein